jgi:hypothetical protein
MTETAALLVPAPAVPVPPEVRCVLRNDDKVPHADVDDAVTTRAHVCLTCLIRLDRMHRIPTEYAQELSWVVGELVGRCCHEMQVRSRWPEP